MLFSTIFLTVVAPALAIGAIINRQVSNNIATSTKPPAPIFDINLFKGNASGPCEASSIEITIENTVVLNSTKPYCFSTHGIPTTCIGRQMAVPPGIETDAEIYEAIHGGLDTKPYQCTVVGYQQDGCPSDEEVESQYHQTGNMWSWDHETRVRDNFTGRYWSVLSFQVSCSP